MQKIIITSILIALLAAGTTITAQPQTQQEEYLGLPGDNLNLYAVMKMFQESETLEGFEKNLNDENSKINNLDLNDDNYVDYIRVIDYVDGNVHNIVLQVALDARENQDVAVFTVDRESNGQVQIQLTGDEALYGRDYIIEPYFDDADLGQTPNPGYIGNPNSRNGQNVTVYRTTTVAIAAWPVVRFIYLPTYNGWRSSWYYGYYPSYWRPWQPYYYHYYYGYHYNYYNDYYGNYRRWNTHRYSRWNDYYYVGKRAHSTNVNVNIQAGNYKKTYSRPETRRDGEAMYTKMNSTGNRRATDNSSDNSSVRRSGQQSTKRTQSVGAETTRRSTTTSTGRSATNPAMEQKASTTRRSNNTVTSKPAANPANEQKATTTRRSAATVTNKSATKPASGQKATSTRATRQPAATKASTPARSSRTTKSQTTVKQGSTNKESETKKTSRR